jgi:uncharacterized membrane protein YfcA
MAALWNRAGRARVLRTPPTPMRVDARRVIAVGTLAWAATAIVLAVFWTWLGRHDHRIWLWTCVCGAILGVLGLVLIGKHRGEGRL